jgi:chromosome segregation ATPase
MTAEVAKIRAEIPEALQNVSSARSKANKAEGVLKDLEGKREGLERELEAIGTKLLNAKDVEAINEKANKTLTPKERKR